MNVRLIAVVLDTSIQCRSTIDTDVVSEYAARMKDGDTFPPIEAFGTQDKCWLGDGWHRVFAAKQNGFDVIEARLNEGGRSEALKHALGANSLHGHRRTNADKRRCVEIALREFSTLSSRALAKMCGVSPNFVTVVKPEVQVSSDDTRVTGQDGKQYPAKRQPDSSDDALLSVTEIPEPLSLSAQVPKGKRGESYGIKQWESLSAAEKTRAVEEGFESSGTMNEQTGTSIEWAQHSLNTVTGCLHDCPYCYARDIAERFYPQKFAPTFHPSRLAGPTNTKFPEKDAAENPAYRNIFANSMSDLFGQWVPVEWINATLEMAKRNPKWRFLTLTKFPQRAAEFELPDNVWMGTTVDAQARVDNAEKAFAKIKCKTKWLSVEPLLEPLSFKALDVFQWVVIGGSSRSTKTPEWVPPFEWIARLHLNAIAAGCKVYHKTNLGLMDSVRVREFPWSKPSERSLPKAFRYLKGM